MAVVVTLTLPKMITPEKVEQLGASMNVHKDPPDGLIAHTSIDSPEGVNVVDIWESEAADRIFEQSRLAEAVGSMLGGAGDAPPPGAFEATVRETFELVRGRS